MIAKVIRFYGGMPEDWLSAPYLHFLAMWNNLHCLQVEEWTGAAIAYHSPKELGKMERGQEKAEAEPVPIPEEPSAKKRFYRAERERLAMLLG